MQFRTGATLAAVAAAISLSIAQNSSADDAPLLVDDLRDDCPDAEFTSIQGAVDAAIARGRKQIRVCKGAYPESVTVPRAGSGLVIEGPGEPADPKTCSAGRLPNPLKDAVVTGEPRFGISIEADGVTLKGLTVTAAIRGPGIRTSGTAAGYLIRDNFLFGNMRGLEFRTDGATRSFVFSNCMIANNAGARSGSPESPSGVGIWGVGIFNTWVERNVTRLHTSKSMFFNHGHSFVAKLNRAYADGSIELLNSQDVWLQMNKSVATTAPEAFRIEGSDRILLEHNNVHGAPGDGLVVTSGRDGAPITGYLLKLNVVYDVAGTGIKISAPQGSKDITLEGNRARRNGRRGLDIFSEGTDKGAVVTLKRNEASGSGTFDCYDSGGPNKWIDNVGKTENKPGLCAWK